MFRWQIKNTYSLYLFHLYIRWNLNFILELLIYIVKLYLNLFFYFYKYFKMVIEIILFLCRCFALWIIIHSLNCSSKIPLFKMTINQNQLKYSRAQHNWCNKIHCCIILGYYKSSDRIMKTIVIKTMIIN